MSQTLRVGLVVGVIGYASVAIFYAAFDLLAARGALYTVDLLGKALFRGLRDPSVLGVPMELDVAALSLYNVIHLIIALMIGLIVTGLADHAYQNPSEGRMVLFVIVAGFVVTIIGIGLLTTDIRQVLPLWSIVVANSLAVLLAGVYLVKKRPGIWERLRGAGS